MFREMRRSRQQLPPEECEQILRDMPRGTLSVAGDGGYPYGVPMSHLYRDGKLFFHCALQGHKLDAVRACDKACYTVLDQGVRREGEWWYSFRSVVCFGRVRVVEDEDEKREALLAFGAKFMPTQEEIDEEMSVFAQRAAVLEFRIEHMTGKAVTEK